MTELGNANYISVNDKDFRELTFAPGSNGVPSNNVLYTSGSTAYTTFRTFAIKIVMTSESPSVVPRVRDFRSIAIPAA